jgi:hypothetical protein
MTDKILDVCDVRKGGGDPVSAKTAPRSRQEEQFIHLVRLVWELRQRGVSAAVDLPSREEPTLLVPRTAGPLKIMARVRDGRWFFTWGRGRDQKVWASADQIWKVVR